MKGKRIQALSLLAVALFLTAFFPIIKILVIKWAGSEDYAHAFFTVPIILYMGWKRRLYLSGDNASEKTGLFVMVAAIIFYTVSLQLQIPTFIAIAMVSAICGAILYLSGVAALRELFIPLLLLILLIPIPDQLLSMLTASLQTKVSQASELVMRMVGVPLFREGNVLHIPEKTFQVVEACSGIRSLVSLVTLSLILGFFSLKKSWSIGVLVFLSVPVAVFVNILRVVSLVLAFYYFKMDLASGTAHTILGLMLFGIALAVLFMLQRMLEQWEIQKKSS